MARDYEDLSGVDDLDEDELRQLVREHLAENNAIDPDDVTVRIEAGTVVLEGRVGTDGERRIAEHVVTDVAGIVSVRNDIVVDALRRAESPAAIDDHLVDEEAHEGLLLGDRTPQRADEDARLHDDDELHADSSTDMQQVMESGTPWTPPSSPTPEGMRGSDADIGARGEDH